MYVCVSTTSRGFASASTDADEGGWDALLVG